MMSVPSILTLSMILSVALAVSSGPILEESTDLVELNHVYNSHGDLMFDQVIFWRWHRESSEYHVRAWMMADIRSLNIQRNHRANIVTVSWTDRDSKIDRKIKTKHYRESWTQNDPERDDKKHLNESDRVRFISTTLSSPPVDCNVPMEIP